MGIWIGWPSGTLDYDSPGCRKVYAGPLYGISTDSDLVKSSSTASRLPSHPMQWRGRSGRWAFVLSVLCVRARDNHVDGCRRAGFALIWQRVRFTLPGMDTG